MDGGDTEPPCDQPSVTDQAGTCGPGSSRSTVIVYRWHQCVCIFRNTQAWANLEDLADVADITTHSRCSGPLPPGKAQLTDRR